MPAIALLAFVFVLLSGADSNNPETTFTAVVRDPTGTPILGAVGRLSSLDRALRVKSGIDGVLLFSHVTAGTHDIDVSAPGFDKQTFRNIKITPNNTAPLEITLQISDGCGRPNSLDYDNALAPRVALSGHVLDPYMNKPISGAKIEILRTGEKREVAFTRSNKKGEFGFEALPAARYDARVRERGYSPTSLKSFFVPRESSTLLTFYLYPEIPGHVIVCQ